MIRFVMHMFSFAVVRKHAEHAAGGLEYCGVSKA